MDTQKLSKTITTIGEILAASGKTLSCAESCTGGGLAYALTSVSGSSAWFERSFVTYSNEAKTEMLGVCPNTLTAYGAVSEQTVREMALGVCEKANANYSVSISGIAGPAGGSLEKQVGTVWFGFVILGHVVTSKQVFLGNRDSVREQAIRYALEFLHHRLVENK